jgi:hypothetical protein
MKLYLHGRARRIGGRHGIIWRAHYAFNRQFERLRPSIPSLLDWRSTTAKPVLAGFLHLLASVARPGRFHRQRFLSHRRFRPDAAARPRARRHAHRRDRSDLREHRRRNPRVIPAREIDTIIDNIGIPNGGFNLAFGDIPPSAPATAIS